MESTPAGAKAPGERAALNPHAHAVFLDGVYHVAGDEEPKFHALPKLSTEDVAEVLEDAARRIARYLRGRGNPTVIRQRRLPGAEVDVTNRLRERGRGDAGGRA